MRLRILGKFIMQPYGFRRHRFGGICFGLHMLINFWVTRNGVAISVPRPFTLTTWIEAEIYRWPIFDTGWRLIIRKNGFIVTHLPQERDPCIVELVK